MVSTVSPTFSLLSLFKTEKIVLKNPTGAAYMAMDKFKEQEGVHKTMAVASAITGQDIRWFSNIANNDYKVISIIVGFFIAG